jgi:hypothetical protein
VLAAGGALYGLGASIAALRASGGNLGSARLTLAAFTALHAGYGLGVLEGAAARLRRGTAPTAPPAGLRDHRQVSEGSIAAVAETPTLVP